MALFDDFEREIADLCETAEDEPMANCPSCGLRLPVSELDAGNCRVCDIDREADEVASSFKAATFEVASALRNAPRRKGG